MTAVWFVFFLCHMDIFLSGNLSKTEDTWKFPSHHQWNASIMNCNTKKCESYVCHYNGDRTGTAAAAREKHSWKNCYSLSDGYLSLWNLRNASSQKKKTEWNCYNAENESETSSQFILLQLFRPMKQSAGEGYKAEWHCISPDFGKLGIFLRAYA